jgi:hypothetical protein
MASTDHVCVTGQNGVCTVCVISNQPIVVAGIGALLAESADPSRAYESVVDPVDADVVIFDVFNLATTGDRRSSGELDKLVLSHPGRVLALSRLLQPGLTARALAAGAVAPVSVSADVDELAALVDAAASGDLRNDSQLARRYEETDRDVLADASAALDRPNSIGPSAGVAAHLGVAVTVRAEPTTADDVLVGRHHLDRRRALVRVHPDDDPPRCWCAHAFLPSRNHCVVEPGGQRCFEPGKPLLSLSWP